MMSKRGQVSVFDSLAGLGIGVAGLAITLVVVFLILSETKSNTTVAADPNATTALGTLQNATNDIPGWVPLVVIAVIGGILLSLVSLFRSRE